MSASHRQQQSGRRAAAALAALALALGLGGAWDRLAAADDGDESETPVRFAFTAADEAGADGRSSISFALDGGAGAVDHVAVRNLSDRTVEFLLFAADGYHTPEGRFQMLNDPAESVGAGTWIDIPESVTVEAGSTAVVPFTIRVPANAEPGDHAAGVAAAVLTRPASGGEASVGVMSRYGIRVMTRVTGPLTPAFGLDDVSAAYSATWHPLKPGRATIGFDVSNTGNTRLRLNGTVKLGAVAAAFPASGDPALELLPGDVRHLEVELTEVWPLFRPTAELSITPRVVTLGDEEQPPLDPVVARVGFWAVPWPLLAALLGLALLVFAVLSGRSRSRRRLSQLIDRAAAEGEARAMARLQSPEARPDPTPATGPPAEPQAHARPSAEPQTHVAPSAEPQTHVAPPVEPQAHVVPPAASQGGDRT